jgi:hypothetical protein
MLAVGVSVTRRGESMSQKPDSLDDLDDHIYQGVDLSDAVKYLGRCYTCGEVFLAGFVETDLSGMRTYYPCHLPPEAERAALVLAGRSYRSQLSCLRCEPFTVPRQVNILLPVNGSESFRD